MFTCPNCQKNKMSRRFLDQMPYYWCPRCDSVSILGRFLKYILSEKAFNYLKVNKSKLKDSESRECPSCFEKFKLVNYKNKSNRVEIDYCPKCYLLFLDKGEIDKLKIDTSKYNPKDKEFDFKVQTHTESFREKGIENILFGLPIMTNKYKPITDYPLLSILLALVSIVIFKTPSINNAFAFDPSSFNLVGFFLSHLGHVNFEHLVTNIIAFLFFSSFLGKNEHNGL
mgnify:CR=1 FL=1